jgi:hypothetical protein
MTTTEPDGLRRWTLAPQGAVQFKTSTHLMSIAALDCLGSRVRKDVSFDIAPNLLGPQLKTPINVTLNVKSGQWVAENGAHFDVSEPKIEPLAEASVKKARDRLNQALRSPLDVHLGLASIYPEYSTLHSNDRPEQTPPIRAWRRRDAGWMKERILVPELRDTPRDAFDRAFELICQLHRPVQMQWVNFGHHDGAHRIALRVEKQIFNPIVLLKTIETGLFVDRSISLNAVDARRQLLGTQMMALVLALRRYGGLSMGPIEIGAYEVEDFDQTNDGRRSLTLRVEANAWGIAVGQASQMKVETLLNAAPKGLVFE